MTDIGTFASRLNRGALGAMESLVGGFFVPPAAHRFKVIGYSVAATAAALGVKNVLEARRNDGSELKKEDVPFFIRPMHGALYNNPYSTDAEDRWKAVIANMVPVIACMAGAYYGSWDYAHTTPATIKNMDIFKKYEQAKKAGTLATEGLHLADASAVFSNMGAMSGRVWAAVCQALGFHSGISPFNGAFLGHGFGGANDGGVGGAMSGIFKSIGRAISGSNGVVAGLHRSSDVFGAQFGKAYAHLSLEELQKAIPDLEATGLNLTTFKERLAEMVAHPNHKIYTREGSRVEEMQHSFEGMFGRYFADIGDEFKGFMRGMAELVETDAMSHIRTQTGVDNLVKKLSELGKTHDVTPEMFEKEMEKMAHHFLTQQKLHKGLQELMFHSGIEKHHFGVGKAGIYPQMIAFVKGKSTQEINQAVGVWYDKAVEGLVRGQRGGIS